MGDHLRPAGDLAGLLSSLAPEIAVRARLGQAVGPRRLALPWVTCAPARRQRARCAADGIDFGMGVGLPGIFIGSVGPIFWGASQLLPKPKSGSGDMQEMPVIIEFICHMVEAETLWICQFFRGTACISSWRDFWKPAAPATWPL